MGSRRNGDVGVAEDLLSAKLFVAGEEGGCTAFALALKHGHLQVRRMNHDCACESNSTATS